jgi:hypothetical protein
MIDVMKREWKEMGKGIWGGGVGAFPCLLFCTGFPWPGRGVAGYETIPFCFGTMTTMFCFVIPCKLCERKGANLKGPCPRSDGTSVNIGSVHEIQLKRIVSWDFRSHFFINVSGAW